ncbi:MAG: FliG C-terminal domain-containing protein [Spirochaetia bacterium]|jgi:flagellar motor switch protein FliG|nr:FliG C-terminal domain-containing protein [Spirochaetia bacterium]
MSDIKKAFDAYKRASERDKPDKEEETRKKVEKYIFESFESDQAESDRIKSGKPAGKTKGSKNGKHESALKNNYFIKETEEEKKESGESRPGKPDSASSASPGAVKGFTPKKAAADKSTASYSAVSAGKKTLKGYDKTAKILLLLGKDEAASVLKLFKPDEIEKIASEMIRIKHIDKDEAYHLLKEIHRKKELSDTFAGGVETARNMLYTAFGSSKGEELLSRALPETREKPFEFLQDIEPLQIKLALKDEPVTMISLVMNYLEPDKSASLLKEFSPDEQKQIMLRMAAGGKIRREIFEKMEQVIKEKVRLQGHVVTQRIDGKNKLANILKFMDLSDEEVILKDISESDPDLSREITEQVNTIEIVFGISDLYLQKVLASFSDRELAVVLKGRSSEIKNKILSCLSHTRREIIGQESDYLGIMRKSEVNIATREFVDYLRQAEKEGIIIINRTGDKMV